jgi:cytochrome c peroxidase
VNHYDAVEAGVDTDLTHRLASSEPMLETLDPLLRNPIRLNHQEFRDLVSFVRDALLDGRARKGHLCPLIPESVPSGMPVLRFEGCSQR